jgi:hypothetical protein
MQQSEYRPVWLLCPRLEFATAIAELSRAVRPFGLLSPRYAAGFLDHGTGGDEIFNR